MPRREEIRGRRGERKKEREIKGKMKGEMGRKGGGGKEENLRTGTETILSKKPKRNIP